MPKKEAVVDDFADIWAAPLNMTKNEQAFRDFVKTSTKVKAVITPLAGQSVNPAAAAHMQVLKKVVEEEEQEIERDFKGTIKQHALATVTNFNSDSESEDSDEAEAESREELVNKPVQREKKKTQTEINRKVNALLRIIELIVFVDGWKSQQAYAR